MPTPLLICDDSLMARRQTVRVLPDEWSVDITFAENGAQAVDAVAEGRGEVLLLDLTMPVMDGFETLRTLRERALAPCVIVVPGDVQPDARRWVAELGALDFLPKPLDAQGLWSALERHGLLEDAGTGPGAFLDQTPVDLMDCFREVANVAMGRAAALLAELLDVFVMLPVPKVNLLEVGELHMALKFAESATSVSAVCQGFIGSGIAGEALLIFNDTSFEDMAQLMHFEGEVDEKAEIELLMDTSNVLIGASLQGIADQLDVKFHQAPHIVLGRHCSIADRIATNAGRWRRTLAVEITDAIEDRETTCDLLLLVAEDSIGTLQRKLAPLDG